MLLAIETLTSVSGSISECRRAHVDLVVWLVAACSATLHSFLFAAWTELAVLGLAVLDLELLPLLVNVGNILLVLAFVLLLNSDLPLVVRILTHAVASAISHLSCLIKQ